MKRNYIKLEWKRLIYGLPAFLTAIVGTFLLVGFLYFLAQALLPESLKVTPFKVGLCVEGTDQISEYVRGYMQQMKTTEGLLEFREIRKEEADAALRGGDLAACIIIPERTAESVMDGTNIPVQVIMGTGVENTEKYIQQRLLSILTECGASLIDVPQAETLLLYEIQADDINELGAVLDLFHIGLVFDRESWFDKKEIRTFGSVKTEEYYLAAAFTLVFIFWGLGNGRFLLDKDRNLPLLLKHGGISCSFQNAVRQVIFWAPYFLPSLCLILWKGRAEAMPPVLILSVMMSLQCSFFFQLAQAVSGGMALNGIWGLAGFFGAGGILPAVFLPQSLVHIAGKLPAGVCMEILLQIVSGKMNISGKTMGAALIWCLLFGAGGLLIQKKVKR